MAERGHSCPQQRASYEIGSKPKRLRFSEVAADKNVRAPPAVTDRLHTRVISLCAGVGGKLASLRFVRWCNGSTRPFGGLCHGSNPCRTASLMRTSVRVPA